MRVSVFERYLRTGRRPGAAPLPADDEVKFNPYHDERGRFTFAGGAAAGMASRPSASPSARGRTAPAAHPKAAQSSAPAASKSVAEIPGFPQSGRTAWRSSNDAAFAAAADAYNRKYGLKPGDADYRTPEFLKAWAMRESGGEGDRAAFTTDPFQVNKPKDWAPEKGALGLSEGQKMTPAASARAALEWLRHKSLVHDTKGRLLRVRSVQEALEKYNSRRDHSRQSGAEMHKVWYARTILQMARAATAKGR